MDEPLTTNSVPEPVATDAPLTSAEMTAGLSSNPAPLPSYAAPAPTPTPTPAPAPMSVAEPAPMPAPAAAPVKKNSSWGALIAIFIMLILMVIGAFYAWGKRIAEQQGTASTLLISPAKRV